MRRAPHEAKAIRVLLVNGGNAGRATRAGLLRQLLWDVLEAADTAEALSIADRKRIDIAVLDAGLPDAQSHELCRRLKAVRPTMLVLQLSSGARKHATGLVGGADVCLVEPVGDVELLAHALSLVRTRRAEEEIADSESFSRSVLEASPDCLKVIDPQGRLQYMNANGRKLMEIDAFDALFGAPWTSFWPEQSRCRVEDALDAARRGEEYRFEAFCPTAKGAPKWWDVSVRPVPGRDGPCARIVSVSRDITERKRAEAALRESEARLASALRAGRLGVHEYDPQSGAVTWDDTVCAIWGVESGRPVTLEMFEAAIHPEDAGLVREAIARALDPAQGGRYDAEFRVVSQADGETRWVSADGDVTFEGGRPVRLVGTVQDITARKDNQQRIAAIRDAISGEMPASSELAPLVETRAMEARTANASARRTALLAAGLLDGAPERTFDQVTSLAAGVLQAPVSLLTVIDAERQFFVSAYGLPEPLRSERQKPLWTSYCRCVIESEAPVSIHDARNNPLVADIGAWKQGFVSYLATPVRDRNGKVVASLCVADSKPRAWTRRDLLTLEGIAHLLMRELENRAIQRDLEQRNRQLELLSNSSEQLLTAGDEPQRAIESLLARIADLLGAEIVFQYRALNEDRLIELAFSQGTTENERRQFATMRFGELLCGRVAELRRRLVIEDLQQSEVPGSDVLRQAGATSYAGFPLVVGDRLSGTVAFISRRLTRFRDGEIRTIQTICDHIATALERAQLQRELVAREELQRLILDGTLAFIGILDTDGTLIEANRPAIAAGGLSREDVVGRKFWDCAWWSHAPEEVARLQQSVARAARGETVRYDAVVRMAGDKRMAIDFMLSPVCDERGEVRLLVPSGFDISTRKEAEAALRNSEHIARSQLAEIETIYASAHVGLCVLDRDLRFRRINARLAEINGIPAADHIGKTIRELLPTLADTVEPIARRVLETGDAVLDFELLGETKSQPGVVRDWIEQWLPLRDAAGAITGINVTVEEVTARKMAEAALRESEERYRSVIEAHAELLCRYRADGTLTLVNEAYARSFGRIPQDLTGNNFYDLMPVSEHEGVRQTIASLTPNNPLKQHVHAVVIADGRTRYMEWTNQLLPGNDEYQAIGRDVTERVEAQAALQASEERFRTFVTTAQEGIWAIDARGVTTFANPRMAEMLGRTPEEMIGTRVLDHCYEEDIDDARERMAENMAGKAHEFEFRFRRADGSAIPVLAATTALKGPGGEVVGALGGFLDLSERKRAEERQRVLMRELAHRGKNLLAVIQSIAGRTLTGTRTLAEAREAFSGRLLALATTYGSLTEEAFEGAPLEDIVAAELRSFSGRARIEGPRVMLSAKVAQTFALIVHELATNATKYGALSVPAGALEVTWRLAAAEGERRFVFDWIETGGPPAQPPARRGFGTTLITTVAGAELKCEPQLAYGAEGLCYSIDAPLTAVGAAIEESPVRQRLRTAVLRDFYDAWAAIKGTDDALPTLARFDRARFAATGGLTVAAIEPDGGVRFLEIGHALTERLGRLVDEADLTGDDPDSLREAYRRCAEGSNPCYEHLRFDFGDGNVVTFERLLVPFSRGGRRIAHIAGLVVFSGETRPAQPARPPGPVPSGSGLP